MLRDPPPQVVPTPPTPPPRDEAPPRHRVVSLTAAAIAALFAVAIIAWPISRNRGVREGTQPYSA